MINERVKIIYLKELTEAFRDYRTLVPMVFLSIILGPLLTLAVPKLAFAEVKKLATDTYKVAVIGRNEVLDSCLASMPDLRRIDIGQTNAQVAIDSGAVDAALLLPEIAEPEGSLKALPRSNILFNGGKIKSSIARLRLVTLVDLFNHRLLEKRIKALDIGVSEPPRVRPVEVYPESPFGVTTVFVQMTLCSILMMMALIGVIYPALDAVTGERERQTLEPLLMTMASRRELFTGKLLTVATISYLSVFLTLLGYFCSQFFQHAVMPNLRLGFEAVFPLPCFLISCLCMLPLCVAVAAASLMFASFARTIQQGQGYFLPLMMVGLLPLPVALLGNVHLSPALALVPFLNSVVTFNDVLGGYIDYRYLCLAFCASIVFCYLIINLSAPLLAREDLLFDVMEAPARRIAAQDYRRELVFLSAIVFLLMFYLSQILVLNYRLFGMALTQILVVLLPGLLFVHFWLRLPLGAVVHLGKPKGGLKTLLATAMLAPGTVAAAAAFVYLQSLVLPGAETLSKLMARALEIGDAPPFVLLLVIGLLPGICEEVLFRGVILNLLPHRYSRARKIAIVGTMFGAFHLSLARFIPTGLLGALLTFIRLRTGSLWPAMLLHCLHNSLSVLMTIVFPNTPPLWVWVAAIISAFCGVLIFWRATEK